MPSLASFLARSFHRRLILGGCFIIYIIGSLAWSGGRAAAQEPRVLVPGVSPFSLGVSARSRWVYWTELPVETCGGPTSAPR